MINVIDMYFIGFLDLKNISMAPLNKFQGGLDIKMSWKLDFMYGHGGHLGKLHFFHVLDTFWTGYLVWCFSKYKYLPNKTKKPNMPDFGTKIYFLSNGQRTNDTGLNTYKVTSICWYGMVWFAWLGKWLGCFMQYWVVCHKF